VTGIPSDSPTDADVIETVGSIVVVAGECVVAVVVAVVVSVTVDFKTSVV